VNCFLLKSNFRLPRDLEGRFLDFRETFKDILSKVKSRLYIASYVFTPSFPLLRDLKDLQQRNVEVRILLDSRSQATLSAVEMFPTKVVHQKKLHMKFVVADGSRCIFGSHNMTFSASEENYELGVYAEGEICSILERLFNFLWEFAE